MKEYSRRAFLIGSSAAVVGAAVGIPFIKQVEEITPEEVINHPWGDWIVREIRHEATFEDVTELTDTFRNLFPLKTYYTAELECYNPNKIFGVDMYEKGEWELKLLGSDFGVKGIFYPASFTISGEIDSLTVGYLSLISIGPVELI